MNDWRVLAGHLNDAFASRDDISYAMFPRSFYGPVLPAHSIDIGWSAISVHWLSVRPSQNIDHLWPHPALGAVRATAGDQARRDWSLFLAQRARELRTGGQLIVAAASSRSDGSSSGDSKDSLDPRDTARGEALS